MKKKFFKKALAFTLAEVLITLSILGVVAAITVPSIIQRQQKKEIETQFAKFHATLEEVLGEIEAESGKSFAQVFPSNSDELKSFIQNKIVPKFAISKNCLWYSSSKNETICKGRLVYRPDTKVDVTLFSNSGYNGSIITKNGWWIFMPNGMQTTNTGTGQYKSFEFRVDLNGIKGPNYMGKDIFNVRVYTNPVTGSYDFRYPGGNFPTSDSCQAMSDSCYLRILGNKFKFPKNYVPN